MLPAKLKLEIALVANTLNILHLQLMTLEWRRNLEHHSRGVIYDRDMFKVVNFECNNIYSKDHNGKCDSNMFIVQTTGFKTYLSSDR